MCLLVGDRIQVIMRIILVRICNSFSSVFTNAMCVQCVHVLVCAVCGCVWVVNIAWQKVRLSRCKYMCGKKLDCPGVCRCKYCVDVNICVAKS